MHLMLQLLLFTNSGVISTDQTHALELQSERIKNNDSCNNMCAFALNNNEWKKISCWKNDYAATIFETGHSIWPQSSFLSINLSVYVYSYILLSSSMLPVPLHFIFPIAFYKNQHENLQLFVKLIHY